REASLPGNELADAYVQVCKEDCCESLQSDEDGRYSFTGLNAGAYSLTAFPPSSDLLQSSISPIIVAGSETVDQDVVLRALGAAPPGVEFVSRNGIPPGVDGNGVAVIVPWCPLTIIVHDCSASCDVGVTTYRIARIDGSLVARGVMPEMP